ncbi:hypothetical protein HPB50_020689 [Hyalomma asiaticum]|uniref:Uncharacterized protein n=1 Tax=Hyalomma asiaticum TaxID=266040 RepID=A0ACB7S4L4_HYAAI|nr:hypothetical protein HPB50_020689 [Hyalomma asiaticum]
MAYGKVEDLSLRAAYCQFTDMPFVGAVSQDKVHLKDLIAVQSEACYAMPCIYPTPEQHGCHATLYNCCYTKDNHEDNYHSATGSFVHPPSRFPGHAPSVVTVPGGDARAGDFDTVEGLASQVAEIKDALHLRSWKLVLQQAV